jgi:hypothetical protein
MESFSGKNVPKSCFVGIVRIGQHTDEPSIWSMLEYKYHYQVLGVYRFAQPIPYKRPESRKPNHHRIPYFLTGDESRLVIHSLLFKPQ